MSDDELRALRARAYGRDADIDGDPAAIARLRALEAQAAPAALVVTAPVREVPVVSVAPAPPVEEAATYAAPDEFGRSGELPRTGEPPAIDAENAEPEHPSPSRLRTLFTPRPSAPWLWLGAACIALAAFGSAVVVSAMRSADPGLVAEIAIDPDASWPESFGEKGPDAALFEEFAGLTIARGVEWLSFDESDAMCIVAIDTEELLGDSGGFQIAAWGCDAGSFPPVIRIEVTSAQPQALRDRFGDGTGLELIMRGDRIEVFADR
ncbi:hypothetical protein [Microbacterium galbinum]|uniref:Uncharacterized protein n=1 Tax=Microbacterium galbinum TaxID=2851646 RepID=A0ABY4IN95_9MICO|nr:hypothetical protein [Microbacterium galbinum]UPL14193.1 hypothetical protein KV396_06775 [Microbacterium galbinum]